MAECEVPTDEAHLVLRNHNRELERLAPFVQDFARRAVLAPSIVFAVELCLDEAISNIIRHGMGAGRIAIRLRGAGERADLLIVDDGPPFDPSSVPPPRAAASLEEAQIGGLGVHLMRTFAASMRYERAGSENRLMLTFAAPGESPPAGAMAAR